MAGLPLTPSGHSDHSCVAPELAVLLAGARVGRRPPSTVKVIGSPAAPEARPKQEDIHCCMSAALLVSHAHFTVRPSVGQAGRRDFSGGLRCCCVARGLVGRHVHGVQCLPLRRWATRRGPHMAGAPQGLSEKGRITASQSSGSKMAETRPNLHWATCVRPAFLLASFLDVNHHATLPCEGFYRSPCRMDTSPLAAPNVPLCHPWYRLASCISRFRGMVSTLLSEWRKARVVSDAPSPALAIQNVCPFLLGRPFCSPFSPACLLFAQLV